MKRIFALVCVIVLLASDTAEARRNTRTSRGTYTQPARVALPASYAHPPQPARIAPVAYSVARPIQAAPISTTALSTSTAQGVANIMASTGRVGHWGGNPGYEGCGMGASPQAAFAACCYSNSGMATVDVGHAQGRNGMWYCCRRYR